MSFCLNDSSIRFRDFPVVARSLLNVGTLVAALMDVLGLVTFLVKLPFFQTLGQRLPCSPILQGTTTSTAGIPTVCVTSSYAVKSGMSQPSLTLLDEVLTLPAL